MIAYCTNVFEGEAWTEVLDAVRTRLAPVKAAVSPLAPFPLGLRLSHAASLGIDAAGAALFRDWCEEHGFFVPTLNGFPYGPFHGPAIKEEVYSPDWRYAERAHYTRRLADLLAAWLPAGMTGPVSTLPVCFGKDLDREGLAAVRKNLLSVLEHCSDLRQRMGKDLVLALEPEPGCYLETADDVLRFFDLLALPSDLREGLTVCYDCCHHAVLFEDPVASIHALRDAGIRIAKVQVSSAPYMDHLDRNVLARMAEPVYLHQVAIRERGGPVTVHRDIPEALEADSGGRDRECRVHFHVPIFLETAGQCTTTRPFLEAVLPLFEGTMLLEIETYTWDVLPPALRQEGLERSMIRELQWLGSARDASHCRT